MCRGQREGRMQEGRANGWSRPATPIPNTKARAKMADRYLTGAHARPCQAPPTRGLPLRSGCSRFTPWRTTPLFASARCSANLLDRQQPLPPALSSSSFTPAIPRGRVHPRSTLRRPVSTKKCKASGQHPRTVLRG